MARSLRYTKSKDLLFLRVAFASVREQKQVLRCVQDDTMMVLCLLYEDAGKILPLLNKNNDPANRHHNCHFSRRRQQKYVEEIDVHDERSQQNESEWHITIRKE